MENLLSIKFWFNLRPPQLLPVYMKTLVALIIVLAISIFIFNFLSKQNKNNLYNKFWRNLGSFSLANTVIGVIIFFFSYEGVPFLSARFWFLVWGIEILIWLFFVIKLAKDVPKKKEQFEKEKEFNKYIP